MRPSASAISSVAHALVVILKKPAHGIHEVLPPRPGRRRSRRAGAVRLSPRRPESGVAGIESGLVLYRVTHGLSLTRVHAA
jgi:hypothetical protein